MPNKSEILITGADGCIGRHIVDALSGEYEITRLLGPDSDPTGDNDFPVDLTSKADTDALADKLNGKEFAAAVHLAFILCAPGDWNNFRYLHLNNAISENMVRLLTSDRISCKSLINFSSLAVYPNRNGLFSEDSPVDPSPNTECLYGLAKFNSEVIFNRLLSDTLTVVNLRLTQVYGPGMQEDRIVGAFIKEIRETNTVTVFGNGERISNFIHIDDVRRAVATVVKAPKAGTYNLGCHRNISYLELAEKIAEARGNRDTRVNTEDKGVRAKAEIDTSKFERTFGMACSQEGF